MNTAHTPGPWALTYSNCWIVASDPVIGQVVLAKMDAGSLADAKLLVAAPQLLKAVQELMAMPEYDGTPETSRARRVAKHAARIAVRNATEVGA